MKFPGAQIILTPLAFLVVLTTPQSNEIQQNQEPELTMTQVRVHITITFLLELDSFGVFL